jgi:hypothetical protein
LRKKKKITKKKIQKKKKKKKKKKKTPNLVAEPRALAGVPVRARLQFRRQCQSLSLGSLHIRRMARLELANLCGDGGWGDMF